MHDEFGTDFFVLRSPLLPFKTVTEIYEEIRTYGNPDKKLRSIFSDKFLQEAIYIASPTLYDDALKFISGQLLTEKEERRVANSLLKYLVRMSSRSTPFGLFAMSTLGEISNETILDLDEKEKISRHLRLDMDYLCEFSRYVERLPEIRQQLRYQRNDSIYEISGEYRYVEYVFKNGNRSHQLTSIEKNPVLKHLLKISGKKMSYDALINVITSFGYEKVESQTYLHELIDNQIIKSELDPNVSGYEYSAELAKILETLAFQETSSIAQKFNEILAVVDEYKTNHTRDSLPALERSILSLGIPFKNRRFFQVDSIRKGRKVVLDRSVLYEIRDGIKVCCWLDHLDQGDTRLEYFKRAFYERYENANVPLVVALDSVNGLGYQSARSARDAVSGSASRVEWNDKLKFKLKKLNEAYQRGAIEVEIKDEDLIPFHRDVSLPDSFGAIVSMARLGDKSLILLKSCSGPSAVNLIGRFCHADSDLNAKAIESIFAEESLHPEKIFAEIVHLPQDRVGNILSRPHLRQYELTYLANSTLDQRNKISVDDLWIKIDQNGDFILTSLEHKKQVLPRMSTAHNFTFDSLPLYNFLCDLQGQNLEVNLSWNWGPLENEEFLPRVRYKNIVLTTAQWQLRKSLFGEKSSNLVDSVSAYIAEKKLPKLVCLQDVDNFVVLDLSTSYAFNFIAEELSKRGKVILQECWDGLHQAILTSSNDEYVHEMMIPFLRKQETNSKKEIHRQPSLLNRSHVIRQFAPGSEWLYFKIYCSPKIADRIVSKQLIKIAKDLRSKGAIDKWFFIRYSDPHNHLRVRYHLPDTKHVGQIISAINKQFEKALKQSAIVKIQIDTYTRELERYTEIDHAEDLFFLNSTFVCILAKSISDADERLLAAVSWTDSFMKMLGFDLDRRIKFVKANLDGFSDEFSLHLKTNKEQLNAQYRKIQNQLKELLQEKSVTELLTPQSLRLQVDGLEKLIFKMDERSRTNTLLIASHIHMFVNRLMETEPRKFEMKMYFFLDRYYISKSALSKKPITTQPSAIKVIQ